MAVPRDGNGEYELQAVVLFLSNNRSNVSAILNDTISSLKNSDKQEAAISDSVFF